MNTVNHTLHVGLQADGTWVLGSSAYFSSEGKALNLSKTDVWIGDMYEGKGIASATQQWSIQLPHSTQPLQSLLEVPLSGAHCYLAHTAY